MKTLALRTLGKVGVCAAGLAALAGLPGCFDNDPGMQEKLIRTQVELQELKQKQTDTEGALQKAQAALQEAQAAPKPTPESSGPSKEQLNDSYVAAAKEMRENLKKELDGYSIINCTLYEVNTVAAMPYTSKVAVALRSEKGQQYKLEMPVGADASGKWKFPTTKEILDGIAKNAPQKAVASNSSAPNNNPYGTPRPFEPRAQDRASTPPPVSGMGDGNVDTIPLNWSNSQTHASGQSRPQQNTAPVQPPNPASSSGGNTASHQQPIAPSRPAPQPIAPSSQPAQPPANAMPSDKDVLVTF